MIINTKNFKNCCSKILAATDTSEISTLTETLELKTIGRILYLNVTNREYYVSVKFPLDHDEEFHATVNANMFLKLISQTTTEDIELAIVDNVLNVKANGSYQFPLIYDKDKLLELPEIIINNKTVEMGIDSDVLDSIAQYNSKELNKGSVARPVQKMYYIDEQGCITFTTGACVNSFSLEKPVKILLSNKIVKLFKLFKGATVHDVIKATESEEITKKVQENYQNSLIHFTLGYDALSDDIMQTKVSFETNDVALTAIIACDDVLLNSVPASAIRARANNNYPYSVTINKEALLGAIGRLLLFTNDKKIRAYGEFEFNSESVVIRDIKKDNSETIKYDNVTNIYDGNSYKLFLDLMDFQVTLESCIEDDINLSFGDGKAVVLTRKNIKNIIPEMRAVETNGK
jgi:hypothetical protein